MRLEHLLSRDVSNLYKTNPFNERVYEALLSLAVNFIKIYKNRKSRSSAG